jgi:hypothetical protein
MMAREGFSLLDSKIRRILTLLATTNLSLTDIAHATSCRRTVIAAINRRFHIRDYVDGRCVWALNGDLDDVVKWSVILPSSELNTTVKAA